jgi:hypothetical protein
LLFICWFTEKLKEIKTQVFWLLKKLFTAKNGNKSIFFITKKNPDYRRRRISGVSSL